MASDSTGILSAELMLNHWLGSSVLKVTAGAVPALPLLYNAHGWPSAVAIQNLGTRPPRSKPPATTTTAPLAC